MPDKKLRHRSVEGEEPKFLTDRMLGTLCRYLRFMGYDTASAGAMSPGNPSEDTVLLQRVQWEGRVLLTRDRELARRGGGAAVLMTSDDVLAQVTTLTRTGLITPSLRMTRCPLCNAHLRPASRREVEETPYAPQGRTHWDFSWCTLCRRLYWMGSHGRELEERLWRTRTL